MNRPATPTSGNPDLEKIDDAVLALLHLTSFREGHGDFAARRAWKGHDWNALGRLHAKGLISEPVGKAKSIVFTEAGQHRAEELFTRLFRRSDPSALQITTHATDGVKSNPDRCSDVILAALWMAGNLSGWSESPESKPCSNCMSPGTLLHLHVAGLIEEPPDVDYRPIRLTPSGQRRALQAYQRLCCD